MGRVRRCIAAAAASLLLLFGAIGLTGTAFESAGGAIGDTSPPPNQIFVPPGGGDKPDNMPMPCTGGPVLSLDCAVTRES